MSAGGSKKAHPTNPIQTCPCARLEPVARKEADLELYDKEEALAALIKAAWHIDSQLAEGVILNMANSLNEHALDLFIEHLVESLAVSKHLPKK